MLAQRHFTREVRVGVIRTGLQCKKQQVDRHMFWLKYACKTSSIGPWQLDT